MIILHNTQKDSKHLLIKRNKMSKSRYIRTKDQAWHIYMPTTGSDNPLESYECFMILMDEEMTELKAEVKALELDAALSDIEKTNS